MNTPDQQQPTWRTDAAGGFPLDVHAPSGRLSVRILPTADEEADKLLAERVALALQAFDSMPMHLLRAMPSSVLELATRTALIRQDAVEKRALLSTVVEAAQDDTAWQELRDGILAGKAEFKTH